MKKNTIYFKIAIASSVILFGLIMFQLFYVLLPIYNLAGLEVLEAKARLNEIENTATTVNILLGIVLVVMLVSMFLGVKNRSQPKRPKKDGDK